jgi:hypothetical protein
MTPSANLPTNKKRQADAPPELAPPTPSKPRRESESDDNAQSPVNSNTVTSAHHANDVSSNNNDLADRVDSLFGQLERVLLQQQTAMQNLYSTSLHPPQLLIQQPPSTALARPQQPLEQPPLTALARPQQPLEQPPLTALARPQQPLEQPPLTALARPQQQLQQLPLTALAQPQQPLEQQIQFYRPQHIQPQVYYLAQNQYSGLQSQMNQVQLQMAMQQQQQQNQLQLQVMLLQQQLQQQGNSTLIAPEPRRPYRFLSARSSFRCLCARRPFYSSARNCCSDAQWLV